MKLLGTVPAGTMKSSAVHFQPDDVLYGRLRPYLNKVYRPDFEGLCSAEFIVFPRSEHLNSRYLQYLLNSQEFVIFASHLPAGDRPRVDYEQIAKFRFGLAPLAEQERIVEEIERQFSRLDAGVENLKRIKANLKHFRVSVLQAASEGRLVPTEATLARVQGRDYEPADHLLARILHGRRALWEANQLAKMEEQGKVPDGDKWKEKYVEPKPPDTSKIPALPDGWTVASLEQLTSSVRVISYGILMPKENIEGGVPYVKVRDMKGDRIDLASLQRTSPEIAAAYGRTSLKAGDLLLSIRGTYGRVAEVPEELTGGNITQDTARLDVTDQINPRYIASYLRSPRTQSYFKRVARGVAVKGVNIADVRLTPIMLPPAAEQDRIALEVESRLSVIEQLENIIEATSQRADALRRRILKHAFEGRLVPQKTTDGSASVLLEQIRLENERRAAEPRAQRKKGSERMKKEHPSAPATRRDIVEVLREAPSPLTPSQLFREAGYTPDEVEDFYAALKQADKNEVLNQQILDNGDVYLTARA